MNTITSQIAEGKSVKLSNSAICLKEKLVIDSESIVINFNSLLSDYRYYFDKYIYTKDYSEEEFKQYIYNPKKLSFDLYGTIEYAPLIMRINNIVSVIEFNKSSLKLLDKGFTKFLNEVITKEKKRITSNIIAISE